MGAAPQARGHLVGEQEARGREPDARLVDGQPAGVDAAAIDSHADPDRGAGQVDYRFWRAVEMIPGGGASTPSQRAAANGPASARLVQ